MITRENESNSLPTVVWTPYEPEEAWDIKKKFGMDACFISGGTLLQTQWEKGDPVPAHLISLEKVQKMKGMDIQVDSNGTMLRIGSCTNLTTCHSHPFVTKNWMLLSESIKQIAAPAVRNQATIGGNISNGYGDIIPALLALDAKVTLFTESGYQTKDLWKWLQIKESRSNNKQESILIYIHLPKVAHVKKMRSFYKKIGRREAFTPSLVTIAGSYGWNNQDELEYVRLAIGGGSHIPQRLLYCEHLLQTTISNETIWKNVYATILEEFHPFESAFSSADYLQKITANIIVSEFENFIKS